MAETDPNRRAWVVRVLGVQLPGNEADAAELVAALRARLADAIGAVKRLKAEGAPELPALQQALAEAAARVAQPDGAARVDAVETAIARALSAARGREAAAANPRTVQFTTLLLGWREAQARVRDNLDTLGKAVVGLDGARADPRFADLERAAASLSTLVPRFGGELETVVDEAINAGSMKPFAGRAMSALGGYRKALAGAVALSRLEAFSKRHVGVETRLAGELDAVLGRIEQAIAAEM